MKERPILFSGPMVKAILEGRKTQTRRAVPDRLLEKYSDYDDYCSQVMPTGVACKRDYETEFFGAHCKYGKPGDRLWVRETFGEFIDYEDINGARQELGRDWVYRADGDKVLVSTSWKPSIHMPRAASRILLEITDIRVERLNDISEQDAIAEGCVSTAVVNEAGDDYTGLYAKEHYFELWDSIHGEGSWLINPWVWCINFKVIEGDAK